MSKEYPDFPSITFFNNTNKKHEPAFSERPATGLTEPGSEIDPKALQNELAKAQEEIARLNKNRFNLLDSMMEMVFLIRDNYTIEYMNTAGRQTFGDLRGRFCHQALNSSDQPCDDCPLRQLTKASAPSGPFEKKLGRLDVEYTYTNFLGYEDERMTMIVMRDISERKKREAEQLKVHRNIEAILQEKIHALKEGEQMRQALSQQVNTLKREFDRQFRPMDEIISKSPKMRDVKKMIAHAAGSDITVLITGESGTGKELVADIIQKRSRRKDKPFLKFNCHALSGNLVESDLFGYEKGAFTGANARSIGKFEATDGGAIFLDEIGDISPMMQASLLRVLENGEIVRIGGNEPLKVDVRIIAATNTDLASNVENGIFRRDLFYRLNVFNIHLPPLRDRKEDIGLLANHFIRKYCLAFEKNVAYLPDHIINKLAAHHWPGNIRELENMIKRAVILADNNRITEKELFTEDRVSAQGNNRNPPPFEERLLAQPLKDSVAELEYRIMSAAVAKYENPQTIRRMLGLGKTAYYEKMKRHGLLARQKKK